MNAALNIAQKPYNRGSKNVYKTESSRQPGVKLSLKKKIFEI